MRGFPQLKEGPGCHYPFSVEGGALGEYMRRPWRAHDLMPFQYVSTVRLNRHWSYACHQALKITQELSSKGL